MFSGLSRFKPRLGAWGLAVQPGFGYIWMG